MLSVLSIDAYRKGAPGHSVMVEPRRSLPRRRSDRRYSPKMLPVLERIPTRIRGPPLVIGKLSSEQRLRREKTFASASTAIGRALEEVSEQYLSVKDEEIEEVIEQTNSFLYTITHRINKNRHNLKFGEPYFSGPADNGLHNKNNFNKLHLYLPLKLKDFRLRDPHDGYTSIHMSRNPSFDRFLTIRSDRHKTYVSPLKVSLAIHELMTHICQSVGRGTVLPFHSNNSDYEEGTHQIIIILDDYIRLTVIPAIHPKVLKKDEDGTIYVAKPYLYDQDPNTDTLWRYDNPRNAKKLLEAMNKADREMRSKSLRLLHVCVDLDPILRLCPQEFVTMVLYNMFDEDVDQLPCWQTVSLESCFINILTRWHQHLISGSLAHPFTAGLNALGGMSEKTRHLIRSRICRLLGNRRELLRLLKQTQPTIRRSEIASLEIE